MSTRLSVGIIGAGVAGLACARRLHDSGISVTLLEKSRGVGGRIASRRLDSGVAFDHGAQYFTVYDQEFDKQVQQWCASGAAAQWNGRIVSLQEGVITELAEPRTRYVGAPTMNTIAKQLAADLVVRTAVTVESIHRVENQWQVNDATNASQGAYDFVVSTAPPIQSQKLLRGLSKCMEQEITKVVMAPCWAVMLQPNAPLEAAFDGAFVQASPLGWIARNSSKPSRQAKESWVLHASAEWSQEHLEESPEGVAPKLIEAFWSATNLPPQSLEWTMAHRWRFALPQNPLPARFLLDAEQHLGACGDWCGGPRVEGAYLSGRAMAEAILEARASEV